MYKTFETERLILRSTDLSDREYMFEIMNSPKWLQFIGDRGIHSLVDAEKYITHRLQAQFARLGYGSYTMVRKSDGVRIGSCGLYDRDGVDGIDIGFALLPQYEGSGYASEGSVRIRNAAFTDFDLSTIYAVTIEENIASQRLLEKLGLSFLNMTTLPNDDEEIMLYRMTREEFDLMSGVL